MLNQNQGTLLAPLEEIGKGNKFRGVLVSTALIQIINEKYSN